MTTENQTAADWRDDPLENTPPVRASTRAKRQIKATYLRAEIGLDGWMWEVIEVVGNTIHSRRAGKIIQVEQKTNDLNGTDDAQS